MTHDAHRRWYPAHPRWITSLETFARHIETPGRVRTIPLSAISKDGVYRLECMEIRRQQKISQCATLGDIGVRISYTLRGSGICRHTIEWTLSGDQSPDIISLLILSRLRHLWNLGSLCLSCLRLGVWRRDHRGECPECYHCTIETTQKDAETCSICLERVRILSECRWGCGHYTHPLCLIHWNPTPMCCPICRQPLSVDKWISESNTESDIAPPKT